MNQRIMKISIFLLLALCGIADVYAARGIVFSSGLLFSVGLFSHFLLCFIFLILLYLLQSSEERINYNFLLISAAVALVVPAYGIPGMALVYAGTRKASLVDENYFEFDESLVPDHLDALTHEMGDDVMGFIRAEQNIDALKDIFLSGNQRLEEIAIQKLNRVGNKSAVSILQSVLSQSSSDVKILAASALIAIEEKTVEKIEKLQEVLKEQPKKSEVILELARAFDLYCHLGVLDDSLLRYYQNLGIKNFNTYCQLVPGDQYAAVEFGRLLLKADRQAEAEAVFQRLIHDNPHDLNPRIWLAEVYYTLQNYRKVREMCVEIKAIGGVPDVYVETVNWWIASHEQLATEVVMV